MIATQSNAVVGTIAERASMTPGFFATTQTSHQNHNSEIDFKSDIEATDI